MMKGRESGMPPKEMWEGFFSPAETLMIMGLKTATDVAEFGCGYGTFTIPAARIVKGTVYAVDIEPEMTAATAQEAKKRGLLNVETVQRDFMADGTGLQDESVDYTMIFNILHIDNPELMLKEAWRILRRGGKLGIVHWNYAASTPRGPSMEIRPKPSDCITWAESAGFVQPKQYDLKPYHYGIVMGKE
jgi:ubiquinone/menaquinone biosynthesis C-methylase UbiE